LPDLEVVMPTSYSDDEALFRAIVAAGHLLKQILGQDPVTAVRTVAAGGWLLDPAATAAGRCAAYLCAKGPGMPGRSSLTR
jgi:two-component system, NarL family, response regulator DevR